VVGTLYFDRVCLNAFLFPVDCHGHAHVTINFLNENRGLLASRGFDVNDAPGNNANDSQNQTAVDVSFSHPHLQIVQITCDGVGREVTAPKGQNRSDIFVNSGTVFFGGSFYGDFPTLPDDGVLAGIFRREATMNGGVIGTLYWNSSHAGSALLKVAFARRDGVAINTQPFLLRNAPGGDPNISANKMQVFLPNFFTDPQLFQIRLTVGEASFTAGGVPVFGRNTALNVFTFTGNVTGDFNLSPSYPTVASGEEQNFLFKWTVHEGEVWRNLKTLEFRLRDDRSTALWVRWDEAANTFQLCRKTSEGGRGDGEDDGHGPAGDVVCGRELPPGSDATFETPFARLDLAESSVEGSGPDGRSVTLNLAVSFKPSAAAHTFTVELASDDDLGGQDDFFEAGSVTVQSDGHGEGRRGD
jgi:hypothetical protein